MKPRTKFGRCSVKGHGSWCSVSQEIQETPISRTEEKRRWKKQAKKDGWEGF